MRLTPNHPSGFGLALVMISFLLNVAHAEWPSRKPETFLNIEDYNNYYLPVKPSIFKRIGSVFSKKVPRQDEIASVQVTVLGHRRWEEVKASLTSKFELNEVDALNRVIPITQMGENSEVDAMLLKLKLAGPTVSVAEKETDKSRTAESTQIDELLTQQAAPDLFPDDGVTGGQTTTKKTNTSEKSNDSERVYSRNPPDLTKITSDDPLAPKTTPQAAPQIAGSAGGGIDGRSAKLGVDPFLQYNAAQALKQSVALLNRAIDDVSIKAGYDAYVVTLQINLMPFTRGKGYDAFTDISFVPGITRAKEEKSEPVISPGIGPFMLPLRDRIDDLGIYDKALRDDDRRVRKEQTQATGTGARILPKIIPLLVTDNLEASTQRSSAKKIRSLTLAAGAASPTLAGSGEFNRYLENVEKLAGDDLNSLLMVTRLGENVFRVRLGAQNQGTEKLAMVPQNHTVHVLVLYPKQEAVQTAGRSGYHDLQCFAITRLRDSYTGAVLPMREPKDMMRIYIDRLGPYVRSQQVSPEVMKIGNLQKLTFLYTRQDYLEFANTVRALKPQGEGGVAPLAGTDIIPAIWNAIGDVWTGSVFSSDSMELKWSLPGKEKDIGFKPSDTKPVLLSEGSKSIVRLGGFTELSKETKDNWNCTLKLKTKGGRAQFLLKPEAVEIFGTGEMAIVFDQIETIISSEQFDLETGVFLTISHPKFAEKEVSLEVVSVKLSPSTQTLLQSSSKSIVSEAGKGRIGISVSGNKVEEAFVHIIGGDGTLPPDTILATTTNAGVFKVIKEGNATIELSNLLVGGELEIHLSGSKDSPLKGLIGTGLPVRLVRTIVAKP